MNGNKERGTTISSGQDQKSKKYNCTRHTVHNLLATVGRWCRNAAHYLCGRLTDLQDIYQMCAN
jgi:hypothetical protein